jgi:hypothetical protein
MNPEGSSSSPGGASFWTFPALLQKFNILKVRWSSFKKLCVYSKEVQKMSNSAVNLSSGMQETFSNTRLNWSLVLRHTMGVSNYFVNSFSVYIHMTGTIVNILAKLFFILALFHYFSTVYWLSGLTFKRFCTGETQ